MQAFYEWINSSVIYFEVLALVIGIFFHFKSMHRGAVFMIIYLAVIVSIELIGKIMPQANNQWLYNLLCFSEIGILFSMYYFTTKKKRFKSIILVLFTMCMILMCYEIFALNKSLLIYLSYTWGLASICIAVVAMTYILFFVQSEEVLNLKTDLLFWISIGLMFYHLCNLPITVLTNVLDKMGAGFGIFSIQPIAGIMMYLSFIIGFIWNRPQPNT